jgi:hypothetical protein
MMWLLADGRLDERTRAVVGETMGRLGARGCAWQAGAPLPAGDEPPALLVAGLPAGERHIDDDLLQVVNEVMPGLPLLLLCQEPLVKPAIVLQGGRALLVGPPLTADSLVERLRVFLAGRTASGSTLDSLRMGPSSFSASEAWLDGSLVHSREFLRTSWWVAGLAARGPDGAPPTFPIVRQAFGEGLTVVVVAPGASISDAEITTATQLLLEEETVEHKALGLAELVEERAGIVHLEPGADHWMWYWPSPAWPLWLCSPMRLPRQSNLSTTLADQHTRLWRFPAAAGDLVVAGAVGTEPAAAGTLVSEALGATATDGGPVLLDNLERRLREQPHVLALSLVEVR